MENKTPDTAEMVDSFGTYTVDQDITGPSVTTPELNNARCDANQGCTCLGDGKWCFRASTLTVTTPNALWIFVGVVTVECTRDNDGSAAWNALGASDRFIVTTDNSDRKEATVLTGSRSIDVRLRCRARYYPAGPRLKP